MITGGKLEDYSDAELEAEAESSSIKLLAAAKSPGQSFTCLLRGNCSFGHAMQEEGLLAVPSPQRPYPLTGEKYYAAASSPITNNFRNRSDVLQIEVHGNTRLDRDKRLAYAEKLARAILIFYKKHYGKFEPSACWVKK